MGNFDKAENILKECLELAEKVEIPYLQEIVQNEVENYEQQVLEWSKIAYTAKNQSFIDRIEKAKIEEYLAQV
ncbi:MAG: hypothetical protein IH840_00980 [Candidatus Heimdallarchaeota archaeon]|nr:hypothetical protein [Candidatus Heimdallarchaeota archaeon]